MKKRLFCLLTALCLLVGMFPAAMAAEPIASGVCGENLTWLLAEDGTLTISGEGAMSDFMPYGAPWFSVRDSIYAVVIESGVTSIGDYAFNWCKSLKEISIPEGVTSIGREALAGCSSLYEVRLPSTLKALSHLVFSDCSRLSYVFFTGNAPTFGNYVFNYINVMTAYFPANDDTWTMAVRKDYGGYSINWHRLFCNPDHNFDAWTVYIEPGCTTEGIETRYCSSCGYTPRRSIEPLGHDYASGTCTRCGSADPDHQPIENPFTDVPAGAFYEDPVLWAVENSITTGATADSFNPNGECLRAHVVTFLHRAAQNPEPSSTNNPFTDVKSSDFFYKPVLWAVEKNITNGTSADQFGSFATCNRAAVVTFLWRAAGSPEPESTDNPFADVKSTDFFYKPVLWAIENGITNGVDATHFGPTTACNRAQVVTFLYRAYN